MSRAILGLFLPPPLGSYHPSSAAKSQDHRHASIRTLSGTQSGTRCTLGSDQGKRCHLYTGLEDSTGLVPFCMAESACAVAFTLGAWSRCCAPAMGSPAGLPFVVDPCRRRLLSSPALGRRHCLTPESRVAQGLVDLPRLPETQEEHAELAGHRHHRPLLGALPALFGQLQSPTPEI